MEPAAYTTSSLFVVHTDSPGNIQTDVAINQVTSMMGAMTYKLLRTEQGL